MYLYVPICTSLYEKRLSKGLMWEGDPAKEAKDALKINTAMAKMPVCDARALHPRKQWAFPRKLT